MIYEQIEGSTYFVENHHIVENSTHNRYTFYYVFDDKKNYLEELSNMFTRYIHVDVYRNSDIFIIFRTFLLSDKYQSFLLRQQFNNKLDKILEE